MATEVKELEKFVSDPRYREKVITRIHKEKDGEYNRVVNQLKSEKNTLLTMRENEIQRINDSRWEELFKGKLYVNMSEGKIRINNTECLFSSIKGAELNITDGSRSVTTQKVTTKGNAKSKKHASVGGAIVGTALGGPVGGVIGGSMLGKTTSKGKSVSKGTAITNEYATCNHLGVYVDIDGFVSEVVFMTMQVDQSSFIFTNALQEAQEFIAKIGELAHTPVPTEVSPAEEAWSVKELDAKLEDKLVELQAAMANKPVYELPDIYRTEDQRDLSDEDYIRYLDESTNTTTNVSLTDHEVVSTKTPARKTNITAVQTNSKKSQTAGSVVGKVVFWILSVLLFIMCLGSIKISILSMIVYLLGGIYINPKFDDFMRSKGINFPTWSLVAVFFVAAVLGSTL